MSRTRKARRLAVGAGAVVALVMATSAPAQAEPPFEQDVQAATDGALTVPAVIGPDLEHVFPTGGEGVCSPAGDLGLLSGTVSEAHGGVHGIIDPVEYVAAPGDVVVTDDGAICGVLNLDIPDGEFVIVSGAESGDFTLFDATATLEITGTGAFEQHIPAGCSLSLEIGTLTGTISAEGPPNIADASAEGVSIAEASADTCGDAYSHLLNVGFDLPSSGASIALDLSIDWEAEEHDDEHDDDHGDTTTTTEAEHDDDHGDHDDDHGDTTTTTEAEHDDDHGDHDDDHGDTTTTTVDDGHDHDH
jgi:hypothetical protein